MFKMRKVRSNVNAKDYNLKHHLKVNYYLENSLKYTLEMGTFYGMLAIPPIKLIKRKSKTQIYHILLCSKGRGDHHHFTCLKFLFIYFWLHWVFFAACGLPLLLQ